MNTCYVGLAYYLVDFSGLCEGKDAIIPFEPFCHVFVCYYAHVLMKYSINNRVRFLVILLQFTTCH